MTKKTTTKKTAPKKAPKETWTRLDPRVWTAEPALRVRSVGAASNLRYGAYRGRRYLGACDTLEAAMELASNGPLPTAVVTAPQPVPQPTPEKKSKSTPAASNDSDVIVVLVKQNPFKAHSKVHAEFSLLMSYHERTVREYLAGGGSKTRLRDEITRGNVKRNGAPIPATKSKEK